MRLPGRSHVLLRGFTLVELMISMAIFGFLSTVVIANYPSSEMRLRLAGVSQSVSLLFREAQMRGSAIDSQNKTVGGYGVFASSAERNRIILFNDMVDLDVASPSGVPIGDSTYEITPVDETNSALIIPSRFSIAKLCVKIDSSYSCEEHYGTPILSITVSFTRPNPMPKIYMNNDTSSPYSAACIELASPAAPLEGHVRSVHVLSSGLIKSTIGPCSG